jgi:hypothetical protein
MRTWPSYGRLLTPLKERPEPAVDRTQMEDGLAKQGQRDYRQLVGRELQYRYTNSEYRSWKTWFRDEISRGGAWFDWPDPFDGVTKKARIRRGRYEAESRNAGAGLPPDWVVTLTIETWDA